MNFFDKIIKIDDNQDIIGLTRELKAQYIYSKYQKENKNIIFVTNSMYDANKIYNSLVNYTDKVLLFLMDDFLTSEALATSPELKINRLETLNKSLDNEKYIIITNLMGYLRFLPSKKIYKESIIDLKNSNEYNISDIKEKLFYLGYINNDIVTKTGEIALRGFVLDIFPINSENPIRISFFGDQIESIKEFDINSQRTTKQIKEITIFPITEFLVNNIPFKYQKQKYLRNYIDVVNLNDYFDNNMLFYDDYDILKTSYENLIMTISEYQKADEDAPLQYMFSWDEVFLKKAICFYKFNNKKDVYNLSAKELINFNANTKNINDILNNYYNSKKTVILAVNSLQHLNKIYNQLNNENIFITDSNNILDNKINLIVQKMEEGFIYNNYVVITEKELFNKKDDNSVYRSKFKLGTKIKDINKLSKGDYIVHSKYGIGRYIGLKTLEKDNLKRDYLQLEYAKGDKLYIPVETTEFITKYASGDGGSPKLSNLSTGEWQKTKLRVKKKIEDITEELLSLYAAREAQLGYSFAKDDELQFQFEKEFIYDETDDQIKVIDEIKKDMESKHPMDRLLCGDVGFGKTEVAFRAAFKAINSGKQVAFLCPTTILSNQHYQNALSRFKLFPVRIALLNRFITAKKVQKIITDLKEGKIDLLIGTHRILSSDIVFNNIGLLIVDEEQRFGVKNKEKIKEMKNNIDVLTLSATPIPRTLQMSIAGIRSLSLIETPPNNRFPVQTYVIKENNTILKDIIYKEISRDGQVFILYNNISDMESKMYEIKKLVPEANIVMAHGKMSKEKLENIMLQFINKEYNVLLCTTIIETGIDIPNVNTLIIFDADHFGLSQLYQIRGRVGRSNKIAYCYLLYNDKKILSEIAIKRLNVIKEFTELGSGFAIAMRDLSIRGAGNILGKEQAGFVDSIGVELFLNMLNEEVQKKQGKIVKEEKNSLQPLISVETSINTEYVSSEELRIEIHKLINKIDSYEKILSIKEEIEDRFGKISDNLLIYMYEEWFDKIARGIGINKVRQTKNFIEIFISKDMLNELDGQKLFYNITEISRMFRFKNQFGNLLIILDTVKLDKHFIYYLIDLVEAIKVSKKK